MLSLFFFFPPSRCLTQSLCRTFCCAVSLCSVGVLQCVAVWVCCSVLQCATHCNTPISLCSVPIAKLLMWFRLQFITHFIEFVLVETNELVGSNPNVIYMRETFGQRSGMAVGRKRRALAFYFFVQICHNFLITKYRREFDVGLCTTSGLAKRMQLRGAGFRLKNVFGRKFCRKSELRSRILFASPEVVHRSRLDSLLHFDPQNICQIRIEKQNASARRLLPADMLERWPQVCRVKITLTLLPTNCFVSTRTNSMKCLVNWVPLRIRVLSRNTQLHQTGCVAVCCSALQCVAVCCSVLQCVAVCCSVLQCAFVRAIPSPTSNYI